MAADRRTGGQAVGRTALALVVLLSARPPVPLSAQDYRARAVSILKTVPLIDGHNDIPDAIRARGGLDSVDSPCCRPNSLAAFRNCAPAEWGRRSWPPMFPFRSS